MKSVYVIIKRGVYQHGVHGIFTEYNDAMAKLKLKADSDVDTYHDWELYKIPINEIFNENNRYSEGFSYSGGLYGDNFENNNLLASIKKSL